MRYNSNDSHHSHTLFRVVWGLLVLLWYTNAELTTQCDPGVGCWLQSFTIPLSQLTFTQNQATLIINTTTCTNITIPSYTSSIPSSLNLQFSSNTAGMNCFGYWQLTSSNGTGFGSLAVAITGASVSLDISLDSNGTWVNVNEPTCAIQTPSITFDFNNATASNNNILSGFMADVQASITNATCSQLIANLTSDVETIFSVPNGWIEGLFGGPPGPPSIPIVEGGYVDFESSPVVGLMNYVLNDVFGVNGSIGINKVVNYMTNNTGAISLNYANLTKNITDISSKTYTLPFGMLTLTPQWVNVSGLNTWLASSFAVPVNNLTLDTYTLMENLGLSVEVAINLTFNQGGSVAQTSVIKANLRHAAMFAELFAALNKMLLSFLIPNQLLSPGCIMGTLQYANLNNFSLQFEMEDISVSGITQTPENGAMLLNNALATFIESYSYHIDEVITDRLWSFGQPVGLWTLNNGGWVKMINLSTTLFPCAPKFDEATMNTIATIYASVAAVGCFFLLVLVVCLIVRFSEEDETNGYTSINNKEEEEPLLETSKTDALMVNPGISPLVRYGVVFVLFANVAMFIASNASLGASVYLVVRSGDSATQFPSLFNFSLINSVRDMWNAKVYALSILIALFSGIWPYTKLFLMLVCWCVSPRVLNIQRRGRVLVMLDAMGKWSLIDSFVLILMMVAFHFSLAPPVTPNTPAGSIIFDAYVEPHFGFYSFLVATMLSLVLTHFIIKIHDFSLESRKNHHLDNTKEALWTHTAETTNRAIYLLVIVTVLLCISGVLIGFGITIQSFEFSFRGAFGVLLKFLDMPETLSFSVISLGQAFPGSSISPDSLGTRFIQVSFFIFAVAMPCAYVVCLLVLWMVPMTYKFQNRLLTVTATIHAWSALEVFVISIIAALLELQQFAQFIIGNRCDLINKMLAHYGHEMLDGDDKCFDVVATLKSGCWVLFAACVIYVVVGTLVVRGCHAALKGRLEKPSALN